MQDTLVAPNALLADGRVAARGWMLGVRRTEWVVLAFLVYAVAAANLLPVGPSVAGRVAAVNLALIVVYGAIIRADRTRPRLALSVVRDWLPLAAILLAYREMGWFALPHVGHALESRWVVWDRWALRGGGKALIESLGPVGPWMLEMAYALVYALAPFAVAVLYLYRRRGAVDRFLWVFVLGVLLCYAQFPFWPSDPPRVLFAGEDLPAYAGILRRLNLWMLGNYGIHTSVFPSAHVAGAFAAAFGMKQALPDHKWAYRLLGAIAVLIAAATVYGRYHYLADASAGLLIAAVAGMSLWWIERPEADRPQVALVAQRTQKHLQVGRGGVGVLVQRTQRVRHQDAVHQPGQLWQRLSHESRLHAAEREVRGEDDAGVPGADIAGNRAHPADVVADGSGAGIAQHPVARDVKVGDRAQVHLLV